MSFFGGGSDFADYFQSTSIGYGSAISTSVNMYVYITVNKRFDGKYRIIYSDSELVDTIDEIQHNIIRNALKIVDIECGLEIVYTADIPIAGVGIGLASSSALSVGVLNALHAFKGEAVSAEQLAREACHLEIDLMGQPIGIQDQFAVAYGGFNRYRFCRNGDVRVEPVVCDTEFIKELNDNLLLVFTGITRNSGKVLGEQKSNISERMDQLDSLVRTVDVAYDYLAKGKIDQWGRLLNEAWLTKKQLAKKISNPEIDNMYETAINNGAIGGKVLGAGGGGFILLYVPKKDQDNVRESLKDYKFVDFRFTGSGSQIIFMEQMGQ